MEAQEVGVFTHEPPGVREVYTAWASGKSMYFGEHIVDAKRLCSDPIAETLYHLHAMAEHSHDIRGKFGQVKEWAYTVAASYAASGRQRYRLDWGRQAARDGVFIALWPDDRFSDGLLPCYTERAAHFGVGEDKYRRVRRHLKLQTQSLLHEFEGFLTAELRSGIFP